MAQTPHVIVERCEIGLARLPKELDGLTIAQLSDFHYTSISDGAVIRSAVHVTNELNPDIAVLTGDYVTFPIYGSSLSSSRCATPCTQILSELKAPKGIFASWEIDPQFITRSLESRGIAVLRNCAPLRRTRRS